MIFLSPDRQEEHCLVRSGLVKLLDHLCSLVDNQKSMEVGGEEDESLHRVTSLAWAGFQVLADRCVSWETQQSAVVSSGLAQQVSIYNRRDECVRDLDLLPIQYHVTYI